MNLTRCLLVLVPTIALGAGAATVACTTTSGETPDAGSSSSGGSSSGGHSSSGSSSGGSSSGGSSSGGSSSGSSSGASSSGGTSDCGAIEEIPPLVYVNGTGGTCDAAFQVLDIPDGSSLVANALLCPEGADAGANFGGCPPPDAGTGECAYILMGLGGLVGSFTVQVSAPGYTPVTITHVTGGAGGCVAYTAPSTSNVTLVADDAGGPDGS